MNPRLARNGVIWLVILVALGALLLRAFPGASNELPSKSLNKVAEEAKQENIEKIQITDRQLTVHLRGGEAWASRIEDDTSLLKVLAGMGVSEEQLRKVEIEVMPPRQFSQWITILGSFLPLLLFGGLLYFMMRQAQSGSNQALSFGKSRARLFSADKPTVTFEDVAGVEEAKEELMEVVEFLKEPEKFLALGARIPKGVLMVGPPGCGKTLMARAVAGEAGVPFFSISGSEFVEMFVGVGASRVRDLFEQAKRNAPCILFVDEIDAVGRQRGAGLGGSHDEREQTLNQILVEMDGFDTDTNVIVTAATNRPDILDPALLRPGRFDRQVVLDLPDRLGREAILRIHARGKPLAEDVDTGLLARHTPGFSGADLENLVNEAAILAARRNRKVITLADFQDAVEKVIAGPERKTRLISDHEKKIIAYHEAGHAVVMASLKHADPVHKVSIVSRGMALGYTLHLPEDDRHLYQRVKFEDELTGLLGGRAAEELVFEDITTGASNDIERVTQIARRMVTQFGMSDSLGPLTFGDREELVFLGRELSEQRNYSEDVARQIDEEVRGIVNRAYHRAKDILAARMEDLTRVARALIEKETLDRQEFLTILNGATPVPA